MAATSTHVYSELGSAEGPIEGDDVLEFRLLFAGRVLGANSQDTRAPEKHELRRAFHPQLKRLWETNKHLKEFARYQPMHKWVEKHPGTDLQTFSDDDFSRAGIELISYNWERSGYQFVPLVTKDLALRCNIEILFLRPDEPRFLMTRGDLDAKVKTVFDALRIPENLEEAGGKGPQEGENPFFCLLQDDRLISELAVTSDELLLLPNTHKPHQHDAFLVVHVRLKPKHRSQFSWVFE